MNYILEGDTNFQNLLMEAICTPDTNTKKLCLISNEELEEEYVTLRCKHTFNYIPLFKEIVKQKKNTNILETQKLKQHQLKCPYCRLVQNQVLPYNEKLRKKVTGVNWPPSISMLANTCSAILKSGKRAGNSCARACFGKYCSMHKRYTLTNQPAAAKCSQILKSGKRKGLQCRNKAKKEGFCGIHAPKNINV